MAVSGDGPALTSNGDGASEHGAEKTKQVSYNYVSLVISNAVLSLRVCIFVRV